MAVIFRSSLSAQFPFVISFLNIRFLGCLQDSSGTTLMDLITADPSTTSAGSTSTAASSVQSSTISSSSNSSSSVLPSALGKPAGEKRSKRAALMQIQNDTISAAKAALNPVRTNIMPQRQSKKKVPLLHFSRLFSSFCRSVFSFFPFYFIFCCVLHLFRNGMESGSGVWSSKGKFFELLLLVLVLIYVLFNLICFAACFLFPIGEEYSWTSCYVWSGEQYVTSLTIVIRKGNIRTLLCFCTFCRKAPRSSWCIMYSQNLPSIIQSILRWHHLFSWYDNSFLSLTFWFRI